MFEAHPAILNAIDTGLTPFSVTGLNSTSLRSLADSALADINQRLARAHGDKTNVLNMHALLNAIQLERPFRRELQDLAISSVKEDYGLGDDDLHFRAELKDLGNFESEYRGMEQRGRANPRTRPVDVELAPEISKRRYINAIIQGGARKIQNRFFYDAPELNRLDPQLPPLYAKMMSTDDLSYWSIPDSAIALLSGSGMDARSGSVQLIFPEKGSNLPITVFAEAISYPILMHELGKGVLEALALAGLPHDRQIRQRVLAEADKLENESWDLRLGPAIWDKFAKLLRDDELGVRNKLLSELFKLPAPEFNRTLRAVLESGAEQARAQIEPLIRRAKL